MPQPDPTALTLSPLDAWILVISALSAVLLAWTRTLHGIPMGKGQLFGDGASVWTIIVLFLISISTITRHVPVLNVEIPTESELIRSNGVLIPLAFLYCATMICGNVFDSLLQHWTPAVVSFRKRLLIRVGIKKTGP